MADTYYVKHADPAATNIQIAPGTVDGPGSPQRSSDLSLPGQGRIHYGEHLNTNLLRLLENFASPEIGSNTPNPTILGVPQIGQLWYNKTSSKLHVFDGTQWSQVGNDIASDVLTQSAADILYVKLAGDTMTGDLALPSVIAEGNNFGNSVPPNVPHAKGYKFTENNAYITGYRYTNPGTVQHDVMAVVFDDSAPTTTNRTFTFKISSKTTGTPGGTDLVSARYDSSLGDTYKTVLDVNASANFDGTVTANNGLTVTAGPISFTGSSVTFNGAVIHGAAAPLIGTDVANKQYVDEEISDAVLAAGGGITQAQADARYLRLIGGTLTGPVTMGGITNQNNTRIINVATPVNGADATTKSYVDTLIASSGGMSQAQGDVRYVNITGDTMTGALVLSGAPTIPLHAATKSYVDTAVAASSARSFSLPFESGGCSSRYLATIDNRGYAYTWGQGSSYQRGIGEVSDDQRGPNVPTLLGFNQSNWTYRSHYVAGISCGSRSGAMFVKGRTNPSSRAILVWGINDHNVAGVSGAVVAPRFFATPTADPTVIRMSSYYSSYHQGAFIANGALNLWGANTHGQVGMGTTGGTRNTPYVHTLSPGGSPWADVIVTGLTTFALDTTGRVYAVGYNGYGALGRGNTTNTNTFAPVTQVDTSPMTNVVKMIALDTHNSYGSTLAMLKSDGTVWCVGHNSGKIGNGATTSNVYRAVATKINASTTLTGITDIQGTGGTDGSIIALHTSGIVYGWGWNVGGELGFGNNSSVLYATQIPGLSGITWIYGAPGSFGNQFFAYRGDNENLYAAGYNTNVNSSLGVGTSDLRVTSFTRVYDVFDSAPHSMATIGDTSGNCVANVIRTTSGTLYGAGFGDQGQSGAQYEAGTGDGSRLGTFTRITFP